MNLKFKKFLLCVFILLSIFISLIAGMKFYDFQLVNLTNKTYNPSFFDYNYILEPSTFISYYPNDENSEEIIIEKYALDFFDRSNRFMTTISIDKFQTAEEALTYWNENYKKGSTFVDHQTSKNYLYNDSIMTFSDYSFFNLLRANSKEATITIIDSYMNDNYLFID